LRITITGTPGTGKTTVGKLLARKLGLPFYELSKVVKEEGLYSGYDGEREAYEVDYEKLRAFFEDKKEFVAEGLVAHKVPSDLLVILRARPETVVERLKPRGYPEKKLKENAEAERLAVVATEAVEEPLAPKVVHLDTTHRTPQEVVELIEKAIKGEEIFEEIDWLEG
jgi:adenylate kinase